MSKCIPCSKMDQTEQDVIKYYKNLYKKHGIEYYVYRLESNAPIKFVTKKDFNMVFESQIKPAFPKGSEYFHIQEFT